MYLVLHVLGASIATFHALHPMGDSVLAVMSAVRATIGVATAIVKMTQLFKRPDIGASLNRHEKAVPARPPGLKSSIASE